MALSPMQQAMYGPSGIPQGYKYNPGGTANFGGVNFSNILNQYKQDQQLPKVEYGGDPDSQLASQAYQSNLNFNSNTNDLNNWGYGGYQVLQLPNGSYGLAKGPSQTGEQPMDIYDSSGKFSGTGITPKVNHSFVDSLSDFWDKAIPIVTTAMIGGGIAGGLGVGAFASGASGATGGAGGFIGEGAASGIPAWDGALASAPGWSAATGGLGAGAITGHSLGGASTAGGLEGTALGNAAGVGTAAGLGGASASTGGLGSIVSALGGSGGTAAKVGTSLLGALTGGGGSSNSGSLGGMSLSDIANIVSGVYGANQQSQSSKDMMDWLNGQQAKIDNLYAPNSPEYNYLWDQMSRQDAASGRNSQYGPRSVDLAARIAQIKADETARLTQGVGALRANTLNQGANAGINATAPIIKALQSSGLNLDSIMKMIGGGASSNSTDFWNQVAQSGSDWGGGYTNPMDQDFLDFINQYGME